MERKIEHESVAARARATRTSSTLLRPHSVLNRAMPLPAGAAWLAGGFDSTKAARGIVVSADGTTASLSASGAATVQAQQGISNTNTGSAAVYFEAVFSELVGGIGFSHLTEPPRVNIYNDNSILLSGYGDLYSFGGSTKGFSPNISRSTGTHYGCLLDMVACAVQFWVDGHNCSRVWHNFFRSGCWYPTVTIGSGAAGAKFQLLPAGASG